MQKIKIFVLDQTIVGGVERVVTNMANYFTQDTNREVTIVSIFKKNKEFSFPLPPNVKVVFLRHDAYQLFPLHKKILSNLKMFRSLWKYPIKRDDILISNMTGISNYLSFLNIKHHAKLILFEHGYHAVYGRFSQWVRRQTFPFADMVVTLTESEKLVYEKFSKKAICIPNALSFYPQQRANLLSKRVMSAGRFVAEKGFDHLLEVYKVLGSKYPDWNFVIFGTGYLQEELERQLTECPANVQLLPPTSEMQNELLNSSIYICTSNTEAFPMVLLEAMACGLPIVSFDCPPGPREIISDGVDGDLVPLNNDQMLMEKLESLINDIEKRKLYSENGRKSALRFLPEVIFKQWENIIDR